MYFCNMLQRKNLQKNQGVLFTYDAQYTKNKDRVSFHRELYGSMNYTKDCPKKQGGLLSEIPFINPTKSCIIVKQEDANKVRNFFKKHKVKWSEHLVFLNEKERKELGL